MSKELCLLIRSRTYIYRTCRTDGVDTFRRLLRLDVLNGSVPLQLSTPKASEVSINLSIVILEHARVYREGTTNRHSLWCERSFRFVSYSYTQMEYAIIVFGRENQVVFAILLYAVVVPHLLFSPGHIFHVEYHTMIRYRTVFNIVT